MPPKDMLATLLHIEWQGDDVHFICPACRASQMHGHERNCALQALITMLSKNHKLAAGDHEDVA